ncbi:MAG: EamA family transporter [Rhodopirellula sp.]|nr:EamA family transporter [Rhodopirellula sp.]
MTWFLLSVLTAVFASARDFQSKRFLLRVDPLTVSWALSLYSVPVLGAALAYTDIPAFDSSFFLLVAGAGSVLTVGWILYIRALSVSDMSLSIPMISFSPLFLLVLAPMLFGEFPSPIGVIGVLLVVAGSYVLGVTRASSSLFGPFRALLREPGPRIMLAAALAFSIAAVFEKAGISRSSPILFAFSENAFAALLMIPILYLKHRSGFVETYANRKALLPIGLCVAMMFLCQANALKIGPVAYVVAIKRFSVLFSVLAGGIFLGEQQLVARLAGSAVMVCGILCIAWA